MPGDVRRRYDSTGIREVMKPANKCNGMTYDAELNLIVCDKAAEYPDRVRPAADTRDDRFNEFRIGLDHLSFTAPSEAALQSLAEKLQASSVNTKGVETYRTGNKYVAFRDPDNVQLEYWLPK